MKKSKFFRVSLECFVALEDPERQDARDAANAVLAHVKPLNYSEGGPLLIDNFSVKPIAQAEKKYKVEMFPVAKIAS